MKRLFQAIPNRAWVLLVAMLLFGCVAALYQATLKTGSAIVLLVPNETALARPVTQAWLNAANEEGLAVVAMTDDAFLRYGGDRRSIAGVILPDTVHPQASELLVNQLHSYVEDGGHLFITFDAALLDTQDGHYAATQSRLSGLAGVPYAMYGALKDRTTALGPVYASREHEKTLDFQPGKLDFKTSARLPLGELTTHGYKRLSYSHFRTEAPQGATALLVSEQGDTIVSKHRYGQGTVLFANLPLGYLKTRTDAYLLHRLLNHFASDLLRQPRLSPVPDAIGGLVLNLRVDANAAQQHRPDPTALGGYPLSSHLRFATFEELNQGPNTTTEDRANYLATLSRYVADQRVARLLEFHPPAATQRLPELNLLMAESRRLGLQGRFRWYTLKQLTDFMNRRELAQWRLTRADGNRGGLTARSSASLDQISWVFPKGGAPKFTVVKGQATVRQDGPNWIVTAAGVGQELELAWE